MCACLSRASYWKPGLQLRYVPWPGIEPATLWIAGQHSIHWATPARSHFSFLMMSAWNFCLLKMMKLWDFIIGQSIMLFSLIRGKWWLQYSSIPHFPQKCPPRCDYSISRNRNIVRLVQIKNRNLLEKLREQNKNMSRKKSLVSEMQEVRKCHFSWSSELGKIHPPPLLQVQAFSW